MKGPEWLEESGFFKEEELIKVKMLSRYPVTFSFRGTIPEALWSLHFYFCGAFIQLPFIMSSCFHWDHHELPFTKLKIISVLTRCNGHFGLWKPFPLTFFNVACLPHHWLFCFCPLKMLVHWAQPTDSHPTPGSTPSYHPWPANSYREVCIYFFPGKLKLKTYKTEFIIMQICSSPGFSVTQRHEGRSH